MRLGSPYEFPILVLEMSKDFFHLHYTVQTPDSYQYDPAKSKISEVTPDGALTACIRSVGSAGLSSTQKHVDYEITMQQMYGSSIRMVNVLLQDPRSARDDKTLLAVMLLSHFEEMNLRFPYNVAAREAHILGALSLIRYRATEQLQTPSEIRLFAQLTSCLTNYCVQYRVHLPQEIIDLTEYATIHVERELSWHVFETKVKFTQFYVQTISNPVADPRAVLERALEFNQVFTDTKNYTKPGWTYKVMQTGREQELIIDGCYHIYDNYVAVTVWNDMRGYRMLANRLVFELTRHLLAKTHHNTDKLRNQFHGSETSIQELQREILATVPQHLGMVSKSSPEMVRALQDMQSTTPRFLWTAFNSTILNPVKASGSVNKIPLIRLFGGCLLPFSLYLVDLVDTGGPKSLAGPTMRILKTIADYLGVRQAAFYASEIQKRQGGKSNLLKIE